MPDDVAQHRDEIVARQLFQRPHLMTQIGAFLAGKEQCKPVAAVERARIAVGKTSHAAALRAVPCRAQKAAATGWSGSPLRAASARTASAISAETSRQM